MSERKARRRRPMRLSSERGDETETREEAYGDPTPQNVNFVTIFGNYNIIARILENQIETNICGVPR